jgi:putative ABC transport system permease protein
LVNRLVVENLKHRPVRTLLSAIAIGVGVTLILSLVNVSAGMLGDIADRSRGTGADIMIRPSDSSLINTSIGTMPEKIVEPVRAQPHVTLATPSLIEQVGPLDSVAGVNLDEFNRLSGGFHYLEGGPFKKPEGATTPDGVYDLALDEVEAKAQHAHAGQTITQGRQWRVTGIVESGKMSRMFTDLATLQDIYGAQGKISVIWVKVDDPANIDSVEDSLKKLLPDNHVYSMDELTSLLTADNIPILKRFTYVVIGIAGVIGFLFVFLSMYTAVLERTREIGILKALGASPGYILDMLLRETVLLAIGGAIAGILMSYGSKALMDRFVPSMPMVIVKSWWKWAALIALGGSLIGALGPGLKAARQDAIEALSYD